MCLWKKIGAFCLLDLSPHGEAVNDVSVQAFPGNSVFGTATNELHTVSKYTREANRISFLSCSCWCGFVKLYF